MSKVLQIVIYDKTVSTFHIYFTCLQAHKLGVLKSVQYNFY